jgi:hypothetical protein
MVSMQGFALKRRQALPWALYVLMALAVLALIAIVWAILIDRQWQHVRELAVAAVGGVAALVFFLYKQHHDESVLFIELFRQFNERFDRLNDPLNAIAAPERQESGVKLSPDEQQCLYDYFNLCAEEYLFAKAGHLDPTVWKSWCHGMSHFANVPVIRTLWEQELKTGSYYGFNLTEVERL